MHLLPKSLQKAIEQLARLPGVGSRTAERYAVHLLKMHDSEIKEIAEALVGLHAGVKTCPKTFALIDADREISYLYSDPDRNKKMIAVVEDYLDVVALEKTGSYRGTYHVLGGALSPIDGIGPEQLTINQLIKRIESDDAEEVILATNASVEGELTATYVSEQITKSPNLKTKVTRLSRGIPAGIDLEYADQVTLNRALIDRRELHA